MDWRIGLYPHKRYKGDNKWEKFLSRTQKILPPLDFTLTSNQPVHRQRHIPHRHDQPPDQNETADDPGQNKVQREQGDPTAQRAAARYDPEAQPPDAER